MSNRSMSYLTPEAKSKLSATIRSLRQRLLEDLQNAGEGTFRLSIKAANQAGLTEANRVKRASVPPSGRYSNPKAGKSPKPGGRNSAPPKAKKTTTGRTSPPATSPSASPQNAKSTPPSPSPTAASGNTTPPKPTNGNSASKPKSRGISRSMN